MLAQNIGILNHIWANRDSENPEVLVLQCTTHFRTSLVMSMCLLRSVHHNMCANVVQKLQISSSVTLSALTNSATFFERKNNEFNDQS